MTIPSPPPETVKVEGDPGAAEAMAARLTSAASATEGQQDFATGSAVSGVGDGGGTWSGLGASAYRGAIAPFASETSTAYTGLTRGAKAMRAYGDALVDLKRTRQDLDERRGSLAQAISVFADEVRSWEGKDIPAETLAVLQSRSSDLQREVQTVTDENQRLASATESNERSFVSALGSYTGVAASGATMAASGYDPSTLVRSGLDKVGRGAHPEDIDDLSPEQRAQWWAALNPAEQEAAMQEFPEYLGNGQGLPASVRNDANLQNLDRDIAQSDAVIAGGALADPRRYVDAEKTLRNARSVKSTITTTQEDRPGVPIQLYGYDANAFGGDGKAIVSIGDLDTARDVAWNVPGMTTDISSIEANVGSAGTLHDQASRLPNGSTSLASVAWIGYDAPSGADMGAVAAPGAARDGGNLLAADIQGFTAARDQAGLGQGSGASDHLNLSLIGHSYGTPTVGWAGDDGRLSADVDTVTLLGSPGTGGVTDAEEFGIGAENVYVGSAANDFVGHLGSPNSVNAFGMSGLGSDPATTAYGAERFRAEGGDTTALIGNHNSYYQEGTESLKNLGKIVAGHGDDISHENRRSPLDVLEGAVTQQDPAVESREDGK
ncbi:alpha/beta hydrolase [Williamsia maris]|uniref:alpha/beta hydrolase n=1 Tax=Williamsia maris TaxID=72806 RepID=UPI0020A573AE|nr:alpha/beta hydrolase [Williamsia maris]